MRIKKVCDLTGLTDRTVRYYIEEQLISPAYTENYLGRKAFAFSDSDVEQLKDIAVLRKFGFSVGEIKEMLAEPAQVFPAVMALRERKQTAINAETALLQTLLQLEEGRSYTVSELAAALSAPVLTKPLPPEDQKAGLSRMIKRTINGVLLFIIIWLPVVLAVLGVMIAIHHDAYPVIRPKAVIRLFVSLVPSFLLLIIPKLGLCPHRATSLKIVLAGLCLLSAPLCGIFGLGISARSETTDFRNYRDFDVDCIANRSSFFQDLFPAWPNYIGNYITGAQHEDAHYLYRDLPAMDYTYDIYAQWPLEQKEFDQELARVQALYDGLEDGYEIVQRGNYTCLFHYYGAAPFEEVKDNYTYYIFAYDEENRIVRYIMCVSLENGCDQPYYLSLEW